jgi:hypothetical protein
MSRTTTHLRRLIGLCLLAAAFVLTEAVAIPAAGEGQGKKLEPPTLLWKSYPLEQRPSPTERADAQIQKRPVRRETSANQDEFLTPALVGGFILVLAAAAIALKRRSMPRRRGKARLTADRGSMPRPARPASAKRPLWRRRRQQLQEVIPEVVREPRGQAPQGSAPQSAADLLEALQLKSPSTPEADELTREIAAIRSEEARPGPTSGPAEQRPAKQPQFRETGDPPLDERETEAGASLESQLELELWTRIADVNLVPVPGPSPQTHEESPPA